MKTLKVIWDKWKVIAHKIGNFQARALLSLFYFAIFGPFALLFKLGLNPRRSCRSDAKGWLNRPGAEGDPLTLAKRQF